MKDKKGKNIDLPPSGLPDDLSKMGTSGVQQPPRYASRSEPMPLWKKALGVCVVIVLLSFLGSLTPNGKTPEDALATQSAGMTAQAVARAKASPTKAAPPTATVTPYPDITMTPTATHTVDEEIASLKMLPAVKSVEFVERRGTDYWASVTTAPKFNKESFAQLIMIQAVKVDPYTFRFAVRIDDKESDPLWWIYTEDLQWVSSSTAPAWADLGEAMSSNVAATVVVVPTSAATIAAVTVSKIYYAGSSGANVRSCPKTSCDAVTKIIAGGEIATTGELAGDAVNAGNAVWYRVSYGGKDAYVYSGVVSSSKPAVNTASGGGSTSGNTTNSSLSIIPQSVPSAAPQQWDCSGDIYNCSSFNSRAEMDAYFAACPGDPSNLDGNGDGSYCESN